jgi:hypothetical protein
MKRHECNKHIYLFKQIIPNVFILFKKSGCYSHMPGFAKVVCGTIALLRFFGVVVVPRPLLHHVSLSE